MALHEKLKVPVATRGHALLGGGLYLIEVGGGGWAALRDSDVGIRFGERKTFRSPVHRVGNRPRVRGEGVIGLNGCDFVV